MTGAEIVARARSAMGKGIGYELGAGGRHHLAHLPAGRSNKGKPGLWCDCSAFVAWVNGYDRIGYTNTDYIVSDAKSPGGRYSKVSAAAVQPGDTVVYGGIFVAGVRVAIGHTGIVTRTPICDGCATPLHAHDPTCPRKSAVKLGSKAWWEALRVVHCSSSNWRNLGDAIQETRGTPFKKARTIFARFHGE